MEDCAGDVICSRRPQIARACNDHSDSGLSGACAPRIWKVWGRSVLLWQGRRKRDGIRAANTYCSAVRSPVFRPGIIGVGSWIGKGLCYNFRTLKKICQTLSVKNIEFTRWDYVKYNNTYVLWPTSSTPSSFQHIWSKSYSFYLDIFL